MLRRAAALGLIPGTRGEEALLRALAAGVIRPDEAAAIRQAAALGDAVIAVDSFADLHAPARACAPAGAPHRHRDAA
jgi:hypothetical protein